MMSLDEIFRCLDECFDECGEGEECEMLCYELCDEDDDDEDGEDEDEYFLVDEADEDYVETEEYCEDVAGSCG